MEHCKFWHTADVLFCFRVMYQTFLWNIVFNDWTRTKESQNLICTDRQTDRQTDRVGETDRGNEREYVSFSIPELKAAFFTLFFLSCTFLMYSITITHMHTTIIKNHNHVSKINRKQELCTQFWNWRGKKIIQLLVVKISTHLTLKSSILVNKLLKNQQQWTCYCNKWDKPLHWK